MGAESGTAIKANDEGDMVIILEKDGNGLVGHIDGKIVNAAATVFKTRVLQDSGTETALSEGGTVERRGETKGVYDAVHRLKLKKSGNVYEFESDGDFRTYHPRARLYEALPSVLLDLNARSGSGGEARDGNGGWARVFMSDGECAAESSTTAAMGRNGHGLVWDMKRRGVEIGYDFPADETLRLGFSAGQRTAEAAVTHGGGIKAKAVGGAVTLGWRPDSGIRVDGHLSYSVVNDIELSPEGGSAVIKTDGSGMSIGVAAGKRMELQGMMITPRAGFEWLTVKTDGFTEPEAVNDADDDKVADAVAERLKGTLGARIDMAAGESGMFWAAADLEHDFKGKTGITVPGDVLKVGTKSTWGQFGLGGEFMLSDMITVSGSAYYAAAGSGNKDVGGSLALNVSF